MTYLDTHVAVWLFGGEAGRLSQAAAAQIEEEEILVSPAVVLELQLLHEIKRSKASALKVIERLSAEARAAFMRFGSCWRRTALCA